MDSKKIGPARRGTRQAGGETAFEGTVHGINSSTDVVSRLTLGAPRMTRKALRKTRKQRPWDSWLVAVDPVPGMPGLVKTDCCPACGQRHVWLARQGQSDPGVRELPCKPENRTLQFRFPDAYRITLAGFGSWGAR
jgi:hypothetical protein